MLGYKLLLCAFFDGKTTLPIDFSLHSEKGKSGDYGLTDRQRRARYSKRRGRKQPDYGRAREASRPKLDVAIEMLRRVIAEHHALWVVERAFRISKGTLEMRPMFHFTERRIETHVCICFIAYKAYKEQERLIAVNKIGMSVDKVP